MLFPQKNFQSGYNTFNYSWHCRLPYLLEPYLDNELSKQLFDLTSNRETWDNNRVIIHGIC